MTSIERFYYTYRIIFKERFSKNHKNYLGSSFLDFNIDFYEYDRS